MKILIIVNNVHKWLWKPLGESLVKNYGAEIHLVTANQSLFEYYQNNLNQFKHKINILRIPNVYDYIVEKKLQGTVSFKKLKYFESYYKCNLTKKIIFADRQSGYNYFISAPNHAISKIAKNFNYNNRLNAIIFGFELWQKQLDKINPNLIIKAGGMFSLDVSPLKFIAKKRNIPVRILTVGRIEDLYYWATDDIGTMPSNLAKKIKNFKKIKLNQQDKNKPIKRKSDLSNKMINTGLRTTSISNICGYIIKKIRSDLVSFYKNKQKFKQGIPFMINTKYLFNGIINQTYNDLYSKKTFLKKSLENKVFFPLQQVPEYTSLNLSWAHDQLNLILECALSLPIEYKLIVKEHYFAMNVRNLKFYRFINRLPNVELVHPTVSGKYLSENCAMVIAISSSALYEAALFGKPVLTFQDYNHLSDLPHVFKASSAKDIEKISEILKKYKSRKEVLLAKVNATKMQKALKKNLFSLKGNLGYIDLHNISATIGSRSKVDRIEGKKLQGRLKESDIIPSLINTLKQ